MSVHTAGVAVRGTLTEIRVAKAAVEEGVFKLPSELTRDFGFGLRMRLFLDFDLWISGPTYRNRNSESENKSAFESEIIRNPKYRSVFNSDSERRG